MPIINHTNTQNQQDTLLKAYSYYYIHIFNNLSHTLKSNTSITMPLFKSNKNKSVSADNTPAQTPRTSMQETRPSQADIMNKDEALKSTISKTVNLGCTIHYII